MYSKQEISKQKQVFWTTFGKYMQPVLSADGEEINWVNYKTGISGITFKMDVDNGQAAIQIRLSHVDTALQQKHYNQFLQLKSMLQAELNEEFKMKNSKFKMKKFKSKINHFYIVHRLKGKRNIFCYRHLQS